VIITKTHNLIRIVLLKTEDAPISIIVEGTTVESTDVDTVPELTNHKAEKSKTRYHDDALPVVRRVGHAPKSRPMSDGHILSQQGPWPSKVLLILE
jgi:uncharacterized lipoprotein NlpE involved in copper resistance